MRSTRFVALAFFHSLLVVACAGLKVADQQPDDGVDGSTTEPGDELDAGAEGGSPDVATPDAGTPPADFECPDDDWITATKVKAGCEARRVFEVDKNPPIDATGVSIARTPAGRIGIVYNSADDAETSTMRIAHFVPSSPTFAAPQIVRGPEGLYMQYGYVTKIAAAAPDELLVLAHDVDSAAGSGPVNLYALADGQEPLGEPDLVLAGVQSRTELGLVVDGAGNTVATALVATGASTAKLSARRRAVAGSFEPLPDVATDLLRENRVEPGAASLVADATGQVHLLFHHVVTQFHSTPRYHSLDGTTWSYRKTVDNNALDGLSGTSPRLAIFGTKKLAAYFFRKGGQTTPVTADLRLATWDTSSNTPKIEILDQSIPSTTDFPPSHAVAMAVDKYGLVHLAIARPTAANRGYLEYRRQTRTKDGTTKWLSDIVDPEALTTERAFVDMVVDDDARPHIAYRSAKDGLVRYATRFDR